MTTSTGLCARCGGELPYSRRPDLLKFCSTTCQRPSPVVHIRSCTECGATFTSRRGWRVCSQGCRKARDNASIARSKSRTGSGYRSRARHFGVPYEAMSRRDVFERDQWRCGICQTPVNRWLRHPDPRSASLDHIIPLSLGGPHSLDNVQCAHLICNIEKGNRVETVGSSHV